MNWKKALVLVGMASHLGCADGGSGDELGSMSLGLGSVLETRTTTKLATVDVGDAVSTTKHTLLSKTADDAELAIETRESDGSSDRATIKVALKAALPKASECPGMTVHTAQETCAVAAGTFDCTKTTIEMQQGDLIRSVETWVVAGIPVPVRSVVRNESLTTITELTALNAAK